MDRIKFEDRHYADYPHYEYGTQEWAVDYCDRANSRVAKSDDGYNCPICLNKEIIWNVYQDNEDGHFYVLAHRCKCTEIRKANKNLTGIGSYGESGWDSYHTDQAWQKSIKNKALDYVKDGNWWFIGGQTGSGKTLITSIIFNELIKDKIGKRKIWTDWIGQFKRDLMNNTEIADDEIDEMKTVPILFIDELIKYYNETDLKYLNEIINYRYNENLKTLITSEKCSDELLKLDQGTFGRIVEKCGKKYVTNIGQDSNRNYRVGEK